MALFDDDRDAWGARDPRGLTPVPARSRTGFMVHYDGGDLVRVDSHTDCLARVRHDQDFHMDSRGWADIGYNGLVCQHGRAIEGRGADYVGAHCPDFNTSAYGVQFMVGGAQVPTPAAFARMARLLADCERRSGHDLRPLGHRDGFATECPGSTIYAWVRKGMPAPTTTEEVMTDDDAKLLFTGAAILKDTRATNPDTAPRVAPSALIEYGAAQARANAAAIAALAAKVDKLAPAQATVISDEQLERVLRKVMGSVDGATP